MKMMTICDCDECKYFRSVDKDYGTRDFHWDESVAELYRMCPLIDIDELLSTPAKVIWERLHNGL